MVLVASPTAPSDTMTSRNSKTRHSAPKKLANNMTDDERDEFASFALNTLFGDIEEKEWRDDTSPSGRPQ